MKELLEIDVKSYIKKKNNMNYLPWSNAWQEVLKKFPNANYEIVKDEKGLPLFGSEKLGYMVYTNVTIKEETKTMWLPVMNHTNKAILQPTMTDVNKALMRCLVKNLAMFGLGLELYAGEDLQEGTTKKKNVSLKNQIINALNHVNVTETQRDNYREEMKEGKWDFDSKFLDHLKKEHKIK